MSSVINILVTGANGQVGNEVVQQGQQRGHKITAFKRSDLDITDKQAVHDVVSACAPQVVINAAAYTAVDRAEQEPELAYAVNRDGPYYLAMACQQHNIPLLHLSTDYVFDGKQSEPYREQDAISPLGVYGDSKWQGEQQVRQHSSKHLILRVSWVFSRHGNNFVKTILRLARERELLKIVADQYGCPTYAGDIANVLLTLTEKAAFSPDSAWGTYHYCGLPAVSWYEFAEKIIESANHYETLMVKEVLPITTTEYPTPAQRPANSVLDTGRLQEVFGLNPPDWQQGLIETIKALTAELTTEV